MKSHKILFLILAVILLAPLSLNGCGGDGAQSPTVVLTAEESSVMPGRIVLDASQSKAGAGVIAQYTFSIDDTDGNTVVGPFTTEEIPELSVVSAILVAGTYTARLTVVDSFGVSASTSVTVSHDSEVVFSSTDASVSALEVGGGFKTSLEDGDSIACGKYSDGERVICSVSNSDTSVDLEDDVFSVAREIDEEVSDETPMWMIAWGANGGTGESAGFGAGGSSGLPGYAQTVTSLTEFKDRFGTSTIYYFLGNGGTHDLNGGSGGTSTLVTVVDAGTVSTKDLDLEDDVILIAGGGGGGGGASFFDDGDEGKAGGTAISTTAESKVGAGGNGSECTGGSDSSDGSGGSKGHDNSTAGESGIGGKGGPGQGQFVNDTWINGTLNASNDGKGGSAGSFTSGGGGGGGYGGGGGEGGDRDELGGCGTDGSDCHGHGGCGGGSYATRSTEDDANAPTEYQLNLDTSDGELIIVFDPV